MATHDVGITPQALTHVDIEVNHRCNLQCAHCSAKAGRLCPESTEMSAVEIKRVLGSAASLGLRKVGLTGGEPLYDMGKLEDVVAHCKREIGVSLHTHFNGTLVAERMRNDGKVLSSFDSMSVTFLGGDPASHEAMTGVAGSFADTFDGARALADRKLPFTVYFIPTRGTCVGYTALVKSLHSAGVHRIRAMALAPSGRARPVYSEKVPSDGEMERFEVGLLADRERLGIEVEAGYCTRQSMPRLGVLRGHEVCMSGRNRVHINHSGDVFPCTAASGVGELRLGNLRENGLDIAAIWTDSELLRRIRLMHAGKVDACRDCPTLAKCGIGCMVYNLATLSGPAHDRCPLLNRSLPV